MKFLLHLFLSLALSFAALASVLPTPQGRDNAAFQIFDNGSVNATISPGGTVGYDPSFGYHKGGALLQVWVGKAKTNVGPVIGSQLYSIIWQTLDRRCPAVDGTNFCTSGNEFLCFETDSIVNGKVKKSNTCMWGLTASWYSLAMRKLLIGLVAATLEAQTKRDVGGSSNCYMMDGQKVWCNVGDAVRINLPRTDPINNFIHLMITNSDTGYGNYDCCEGNKRQLIDEAVDGLGNEISEAYRNTPFTRETRCIIDGWKVCGE